MSSDPRQTVFAILGSRAIGFDDLTGLMAIRSTSDEH